MTRSDASAPRTTGDVLRAATIAHPERDAYVQGDRRLTYAQLDRAVDGVAAALGEAGVRKGDVVGLMLPSSVDFPIAYLGAVRAGAITSAINLRLGAGERASIVTRTEPRVAIAADGVEVPAGAGAVWSVRDLHDAATCAPAGDRLPSTVPTDPVAIVWTSGTTGAPKGAVFDHECLRVIHEGMGELTAPGDRRLVTLPFPHVGYMTRVWDECAAGTTLVLIEEPWSADQHLRLVERERITMVTGVPTQWSLVLAHPDCAHTDFSSLRIAGIGAAAIPPELVRRMRDSLGCPVITRYTSTEAGITTGTRLDDPPEVVATTVGRPSPVVEMRIVGEDGREVAPGDVGEIRCRSRAMFRAYWRDPETTAAALDADGFLHTGDLGFFGADGNLRIVGRLKEMYIRGGYNVYPAEVEGVLAEHPQVEKAAVVGYPDPVLGERGCAFVVPANGTESGAPALDSLREWCRARIADYKAPDRLVLVDELPVTSMLKVDKQALQPRATEEP